ncbi:MAG TPA: A/G-specific adenine glycosylase [Thermoanaerobaculia bacterium]|nr:A/G-specific adenine glycosylase [Thermoanaerobaculia bacterium]
MPQPAPDLLAWFDRHRRDLPWRRTRDPYRIWLSEVMLQQTRVEVVLPYYERFLARFPTIEELAAAGIDEVLALWSGLGYYRRARQLHAAARQVAASGGFPSTLDGWLALPGVGAYTAAAVASIAFGVAVPVLDGNVERVLSRWLALAADPRSSGARRELLAAAAGLLAAERPGDSNQALMELGATLCTPRRPKCLLCPLASGCRAAAAGDPEIYPAAKAKRESEKRRLVVAVAEREERVLLFRRPDDSSLLAGTWELPWVGEDGDAAPEPALACRYGGIWRLGPRLAEVRHGITYRDLEIAVHRAEVAEAPFAAEAAGWFDAAGRKGLAVSSLVGKVLRAVERGATPPAASSAPGADPPARRSRSRRPG